MYRALCGPHFSILYMSISWEILFKALSKSRYVLGFPGSSVVKNPPANAGDTGEISDLGRSHMRQSYWAPALQLLSLCSRAWELQPLNPHALSLRSATGEASARQLEEPLLAATGGKSTQEWRPSADKNKIVLKMRSDQTFPWLTSLVNLWKDRLYTIKVQIKKKLPTSNFDCSHIFRLDHLEDFSIFMFTDAHSFIIFKLLLNPSLFFWWVFVKPIRHYSSLPESIWSSCGFCSVVKISVSLLKFPMHSLKVFFGVFVFRQL